LDSNVLIAATITTHRRHQRSLELVEAGLKGNQSFAVAEQILLEWYSVVTSNRQSFTPLAPNQAHKFLKRYTDSNLTIIQPTRDTFNHFVSIAGRPPVRGKDIFDRYLAATALSNGIATILTENIKDFAGIPGLTAVNPFI